MAKKNKRTTSIINALKCIDSFSQADLEEIELMLKKPEERNKLLNELRLPIKKGQLIKQIRENKFAFDIDKILKCDDIEVISNFEQQILLDIRKNNLINKINARKVPIPKHIIKDIVLCVSLSELNGIVNKLPQKAKLELGILKSRFFEPNFVSIIPIYTPMGNKR